MHILKTKRGNFYISIKYKARGCPDQIRLLEGVESREPGSQGICTNFENKTINTLSFLLKCLPYLAFLQSLIKVWLNGFVIWCILGGNLIEELFMKWMDRPSVTEMEREVSRQWIDGNVKKKKTGNATEKEPIK